MPYIADIGTIKKILLEDLEQTSAKRIKKEATRFLQYNLDIHVDDASVCAGEKDTDGTIDKDDVKACFPPLKNAKVKKDDRTISWSLVRRSLKTSGKLVKREAVDYLKSQAEMSIKVVGKCLVGKVNEGNFDSVTEDMMKSCMIANGFPHRDPPVYTHSDPDWLDD